MFALAFVCLFLYALALHEYCLFLSLNKEGLRLFWLNSTGSRDQFGTSWHSSPSWLFSLCWGICSELNSVTSKQLRTCTTLVIAMTMTDTRGKGTSCNESSSYLKCPTCWAQSAACRSQSWLCNFRTPWGRSSEISSKDKVRLDFRVSRKKMKIKKIK